MSVEDCDQAQRERGQAPNSQRPFADNNNSRRPYAASAQHMVEVVEQLMPSMDNSSIAWIFTTRPLPMPTGTTAFRVPLTTSLNISAEGLSWWAPRTGQTPTDNLLAFDPPLRPARRLLFGAVDNAPASAEETPLPMAVAYSAALGFGVGLLPNVSDTAIAGELVVGGNVGVSWTRLYDRLDHRTGQPVTYTTHLIGLGSGPPSALAQGLYPELAWRPAMAWMQAHFPSYLLPLLPADEGLGIYDCAAADAVNASFLQQAGASVNWDAHFWWPYIGMTAPPNATWRSNTGSGEETQCGGYTHGDRVSREAMAAYFTNLDQVTNGSMHAMSYFNLYEFGENVHWPLPASVSPVPTADDWTNSSLYLWRRLNASVLRAAPAAPTYTWQNAVVLDPGSPDWASLLLDSAIDHGKSFGSVPGWRGLIVDRTDHTRRFNRDADDGRTWCGGPCRALLLPFLNVSQQVGAALRTHGGDAVRMYMNFQGNHRADTLLAFDGIFTEDTGDMVTHNAAALSGMAMPVMAWTYGASDLTSFPGQARGYLQYRLLLGVAPMAPAAGADHSIPAAVAADVLAAYLDHGALFQALRGRLWWLRGDAVRAGGAAATSVRSNAFVLPGPNQLRVAHGGSVADGGVAVAAVFTTLGGRVVEENGTAAALAATLADVWPAAVTVECRALVPAAGSAWASVQIERQGGYVHTVGALPFATGCVLLQCEAAA
jgi:hypothetical protein